MTVIGPNFGGARQMLGNFTWRDIVLFVVALAIANYLMVQGVIITVDRLMYVNWDPETGAPMLPVKFERPTI
jgi:hypothetical protein